MSSGPCLEHCYNMYNNIYLFGGILIGIILSLIIMNCKRNTKRVKDYKKI